MCSLCPCHPLNCGLPNPSRRAMLGYFSGEWIFVVALGLGSAICFAVDVVGAIESVLARWVVALLSSFVFYGFLRLAGRTPIGIIYETHPAARGHPILSLMASILLFAVFGLNILMM